MPALTFESPCPRCHRRLSARGIRLARFALLATTTVAYGVLVPPLIVAGVGVSMALPVVPNAIAAAVFASNGHPGSAAGFASGFRPALLVVASLSLAGAITALGMRSRPAAVAQAHSVAEAA